MVAEWCEILTSSRVEWVEFSGIAIPGTRLRTVLVRQD